MAQNTIFRIDLETQPAVIRTNYSLAGNNSYKLYLFGGVNPEGDALNSVETFDVGK